jgi:DNA invertase Pin-like site-specific DNA recombinase
VIDIYARVSRLRDQDQTSTAGQVASCLAVLTERGLEVGEVYVDDGRSAWSPEVYRPGWNAVMERIESGASGGVIVYDLERFARQLADGERLVTAAERGILVLDSESSYDLTQPNGKRDFRNAIVAAAWYSDNLQRKVRRGKAAKAHSGRVDRRRSFGFEPDGVTVIPEEAEVIRDCAARLLRGETQSSLIAELNERGTGVRGAEWTYTTFRQIMTRPRNAGLIAHNGEAVGRLPGEPILDKLTHSRLVAEYSRRKRGRPYSQRYTLTGIALCGECGSGLSGRPVSGTGRTQYWCRNCRRVFVDASRLDEWAGHFAIRELSDISRQEVLGREDAERERVRQDYLAESASIEATLTEISGRLGRQEISLARHDAICAPLEERQRDIRAELRTLAEEEPEPVPPGRTIPARDVAFVDWLDRWDEGTPGERRAMVIRALNGRRLTVGRALRDGRLMVGNNSRRFDPGRVRIVSS